MLLPEPSVQTGLLGSIERIAAALYSWQGNFALQPLRKQLTQVPGGREVSPDRVRIYVGWQIWMGSCQRLRNLGNGSGNLPAGYPGTSSKRSTSTSPKSVIFRWGMTGRGRNARCRKGSGSRHPI